MSLRNLNVKIKIPKLFRNKLKNKRILKTLKKFEKSLNIEDDFIVAVSGGPDSLALAFLSKIYVLLSYNEGFRGCQGPPGSAKSTQRRSKTRKTTSWGTTTK